MIRARRLHRLAGLRRLVGFGLVAALAATACTRTTTTPEAAASSRLRPTDPLVSFALGTWGCESTLPMTAVTDIVVSVTSGQFTVDADLTAAAVSAVSPATTLSDEVVAHWRYKGLWQLTGTSLRLDGGWAVTDTTPAWTGDDEALMVLVLDGVSLDATSLAFTSFVEDHLEKAVPGTKLPVSRTGDDALTVSPYACTRTSR